MRIIIVGDVKVGKTSILRRFTQHRFENESSLNSQECSYTPTIGSDYCRIDIQLNNSICVRLQLWDTSGAEKFEDITGQCLQQTCPDGIIIVCDNTSDSIGIEESVRKWYKFIFDKVSSIRNIPMILFVNKNDELNESQATRDILEMGKKIEQVCQELNLLTWFATSARKDMNIGTGFHTLLEDILKRRGVVFSSPLNQQWGSFSSNQNRERHSIQRPTSMCLLS